MNKMKPLTDYLRFAVGRDCEVIVAFYGGPITQECIEKFQAVLELSKDCYPKADGPEPFDPDSSRPTTEAVGVVADMLSETSEEINVN